MSENYEHIAEIYKLFSHPIRLAVMNLLKGGEMSAQELAKRLGVPSVTLSQHLARLRRLRVIKVKRKGVSAYYSLAEPRILKSCDIIKEFYRKSGTH